MWNYLRRQLLQEKPSQFGVCFRWKVNSLLMRPGRNGVASGITRCEVRTKVACDKVLNPCPWPIIYKGFIKSPVIPLCGYFFEQIFNSHIPTRVNFVVPTFHILLMVELRYRQRISDTLRLDLTVRHVWFGSDDTRPRWHSHSPPCGGWASCWIF